MMKKISTVALAGMLIVPAAAAAGSPSSGGVSPDIAERIEDLSRELDELKAQFARQNEAIVGYGDKVEGVESKVGSMHEKVEDMNDPRLGTLHPGSHFTEIFAPAWTITVRQGLILSILSPSLRRAVVSTAMILSLPIDSG